MNTPVKFHIAKLLKEKGIKIETEELLFFKDEVNNIEEHQLKNRDIIYTNNDYFGYIIDENEYQTYTIAEIIKWIYEKYDVWIFVERGKYKEYLASEDEKLEFSYVINRNVFHTISSGILDLYKSPEEAYEACFKYILENDILKNL